MSIYCGYRALAVASSDSPGSPSASLNIRFCKPIQFETAFLLLGLMGGAPYLPVEDGLCGNGS